MLTLPCIVDYISDEYPFRKDLYRTKLVVLLNYLTFIIYDKEMSA